MCAGAILNARIPKVFYGAPGQAPFGACGGVTNLFMEQFPHRPALVGGILAEDCQAVHGGFFRETPSGKAVDAKFLRNAERFKTFVTTPAGLLNNSPVS